jgi:hypothetical protein
VVAEILKGSGRERYDYFLKHGFPRWRGTGYYYSRFRPGLGSVLVGLFIAVGGGAHYAALVLSWRRQVEFVERYIRHARRAAWGDELGIKGIGGLENFGAGSGSAAGTGADAGEDAPVVMNRRQKRMMDKENKKEKKSKVRRDEDSPGPAAGTVSPAGDRKRVVAENGKVLIVDATGNVFLEEENEDGVTEEYLLDTSEIQRPTIRDTMVFRVPAWMFRQTIGRVVGRPKAENAEVEEVADFDSDSAQENIPTPPSSDDNNHNSNNNEKKKKGKKGRSRK